MKECHQDIEVTDMSGVEDEIRAERMEMAEASGEALGMGGGGGGGGAAFSAAITHEEKEMVMKKKMINSTVKGMASKVKGKMKK